MLTRVRGARSEHIGERDSALLLEVSRNIFGALGAEFLIQRGAADLRSVAFHEQDISNYRLWLLCELLQLLLVLRFDGGAAIGEIHGGFTENVVVAKLTKAQWPPCRRQSPQRARRWLVVPL